MSGWWKKLGIVFGLSLLLLQPDVANGLVAFVVAGVVPGLGVVLPFWLTILMMAAIGVSLIYWLMRQPMFIGDSLYQEKQAKAAARADVVRIVSRPHTTRAARKPARTRKRYLPIHSTSS